MEEKRQEMREGKGKQDSACHVQLDANAASSN